MVLALAASHIATGAVARDLVTDESASPKPQAAQVDLSEAFHTKSVWKLVVTEGPQVEDYGGNAAPGALTLCLRTGPSGPCLTAPVTPTLRATAAGDPRWEPHYLLSAKFVYPRGPKAAPFLLIQTGSLSSGDGDQLIATQLVAYDAGQDAFQRVFERSVGRNNNQEVRFVASGRLQGDVITATPQDRAPYRYWIVVDRLSNRGAYRQALRYASATRYNDGNPLAVIDSETPNILHRLGLWPRGQPAPTPSELDGPPCSRPTIRHGELWCDDPKSSVPSESAPPRP